MKRTLVLGIIMFIIGVGISVIFEYYFENTVLYLYIWSTNGNIQFVDKNICFFTTSLYYLSFGISFAVMGIRAGVNNVRENVREIAVWVIIFCVSLIVICALIANMKVAQCTLCEDGVLELSYYDSNYGQILGICALLAAIPKFVKLVVNKKKASVQL